MSQGNEWGRGRKRRKMDSDKGEEGKQGGGRRRANRERLEVGGGKGGEKERQKRGRRRRQKEGTGLWSIFKGPSASPACGQLVEEIPRPRSRQGELENKYLWVGADICKHS